MFHSRPAGGIRSAVAAVTVPQASCAAHTHSLPPPVPKRKATLQFVSQTDNCRTKGPSDLGVTRLRLGPYNVSRRDSIALLKIP